MNEQRKPEGGDVSRPAGQQASRPAGHRNGGPAERRATMSGRKAIRHHWDLEAHKLAVDVAMRVFKLSKLFPSEEKFSLIDQVRRSSPPVATNMPEGGR